MVLAVAACVSDPIASIDDGDGDGAAPRRDAGRSGVADGGTTTDGGASVPADGAPSSEPDAHRDDPWPRRDGGPAPLPTGEVPSWVAALPLFEWYAIPGTALSSVDPSPQPFGNTGPASKIIAWCGATLRRRHSVYMVGLGGGHADYAGNEVDELMLGTETPRWVEARGPTPDDQLLNRAQYYLDLRPAATHTYYATQFIEARNRFVVINSPGMLADLPDPPSDWPYRDGSGHSASFDVARGDWDPPDYFARFPGTGDFTAALVVKHQVTEDIYTSRNDGDGFYRWEQATNTWTRLSGVARSPWYSGAAIDPTRDRMLVVGSYEPFPPTVLALDGATIDVTFGGLGAGPLTLNGYPGVLYDEANDDFLVVYNQGRWDSGGTIEILRVDAETFEVDAPPITGERPTARQSGINGSAQYAPELRGFVIATRHDGDVYFMRTAP
jgi:hypothetical protein